MQEFLNQLSGVDLHVKLRRELLDPPFLSASSGWTDALCKQVRRRFVAARGCCKSQCCMSAGATNDGTRVYWLGHACRAVDACTSQQAAKQATEERHCCLL